MRLPLAQLHLSSLLLLPCCCPYLFPPSYYCYYHYRSTRVTSTLFPPPQAALVLRVMQDSPGSCLSSAWSPAPTLLASASASSAAAMQCLRLAGSPHLKKVLGMTGRDLDDWAARELRAQGQDRWGEGGKRRTGLT